MTLEEFNKCIDKARGTLKNNNRGICWSIWNVSGGYNIYKDMELYFIKNFRPLKVRLFPLWYSGFWFGVPSPSNTKGLKKRLKYLEKFRKHCIKNKVYLEW